MVDQAEIHIELSRNEPLSDIEMLSLGMEMAIRAKVPSLEKVIIIPHSASDILDKSTTPTKTNMPRYIKWRQSASRFNRNRQKTKENKT
jgi:hypothetical protein